MPCTSNQIHQLHELLKMLGSGQTVEIAETHGQ
jgi:hypothetical protein